MGFKSGFKGLICVLGRQYVGRTGGRTVCADTAVMVSVSTREMIRLWDADFLFR